MERAADRSRSHTRVHLDFKINAASLRRVRCCAPRCWIRTDRFFIVLAKLRRLRLGLCLMARDRAVALISN